MTNDTKKLPLSCFIIAMNEEDRIGRTIEAVRHFVDEVVVIDSGSTDKTQEICRSLGATFLHNDWSGYGPQKNFGEDQCKHDWVLNLDADEVPTSALCEEIITLMSAGEPQLSCYSIYFPTVYPGAKKPRPFADYHNYIRLYDRRKVRFSNSAVHDTVTSGDYQIGQLKAPAYHYSYRSLSHLLEKFNFYTDLQANTMKRRAIWKLKLRLLSEFPLGFLKFYILRRHITGGFEGFTRALAGASFRHFRIAKMLELAQKQRPDHTQKK